MCWSPNYSDVKFYDGYHQGNIRTRHHWKFIDVYDLLRLKLEDSTMQAMFLDAPLSQEFDYLLLFWWKTKKNLATKVIDCLKVPDQVKTLVYKLKHDHYFIPTLLHILKFDDYPLLMYRRYDAYTTLFANVEINACQYSLIGPKIDIMSPTHKQFIVIESEQVNNIKNYQVVTEMFIAMHNAAQRYKGLSQMKIPKHYLFDII
ncbi:hypothetical protein INT43_003049 [Umbelopsis isabellina]|uniref:Uncharacterized protein n=1 Tax=Mortierella isabellina TaxID=91625 RepID=A0A8H7UDQ5_MORIS|nr:hypothetical protein INT43_003049 [Umbelopsis isabellina]